MAKMVNNKQKRTPNVERANTAYCVSKSLMHLDYLVADNRDSIIEHHALSVREPEFLEFYQLFRENLDKLFKLYKIDLDREVRRFKNSP